MTGCAVKLNLQQSVLLMSCLKGPAHVVNLQSWCSTNHVSTGCTPVSCKVVYIQETLAWQQSLEGAAGFTVQHSQLETDLR